MKQFLTETDSEKCNVCNRFARLVVTVEVLIDYWKIDLAYFLCILIYTADDFDLVFIVRNLQSINMKV